MPSLCWTIPLMLFLALPSHAWRISLAARASSRVTRQVSTRRGQVMGWAPTLGNGPQAGTTGRAGRLVVRAASTLEECRPPSVLDESGEMAKQYDFKTVEQPLYKWWESSGFFKPIDESKNVKKRKPYVIPMPPPNVTGYLHMGHAMFVALQDILARYHRMRGRPTLWLPGTDHAGIATQMLVERALNEEGIKRQDLGREGFLEKVWEWKTSKGGYITKQMRRLGASADWSREKFTLDPDMSEAVTEAFVRMHDQGLIYKGNYMVNWSPNLQTAVSDLEVEYREVPDGKLYYFKYMVAGGGPSDFIPVATTRPETILGDTAVCVHPDDERYKHLVGKQVVVPFQNGRTVPVIGDTYVDMTFGTGALKITPGHDPNDYEIGKRHELPIINIMNRDASINENGGDYQGMDRFACREKLWADMDAAGLTIKVEKHAQRVPISQRGGEVVEPLVSTQWFLKMDGMAAKALEVVRTGEVKIMPDMFEKIWYNWLENIHDWCISRQLWWGHRIPVWYVDGTEEYVVARNEEEALAKARELKGKQDVSLRQDEDVLDTWFSSGLWPFSTVGWPRTAEQSPDLARFYPATVLETGYDILFFWVARMVMMGLQLTGQAPFEVIYMHGLVRDGQGQKMSKTKGNVIDPLDTIDKYGTDALRYSLVTGVTPGQDVPLSMEKVEANRNFANKLWNAGRYLIGNLKGLPEEEVRSLAVSGRWGKEEIEALSLPERYIVSRVHDLVGKVTQGLESYEMGDAGRLIYEFLWDEYADWYIEASKTRMQNPEAARASRRVLVYVFDTCLRLLHPYMPFVTEILWQQLPHDGPSIMVAPWPQDDTQDELYVDRDSVSRFNKLQALVRSIRNARAEYKVEPGKKVAAIIQLADPALRAQMQEEKDVIALLARVDVGKMTFGEVSAYSGGKAVRLIVEDGLEAYLPLADLVDADKERERLSKQATKLAGEIEGLEKRLSGKAFLDKAPPELVEQTKQSLAEKSEQLATINKSIQDLLATAA